MKLIIRSFIILFFVVISINSNDVYAAKKKGLGSPKDHAQLTDWVKDGKKVYNNMCLSCHGAAGKGDGTSGAALNPKPRDFTSKTGWINSYNAEGVYKASSEGIKNGSTGMIGFATSIKPADFSKLVYYIAVEFLKEDPKKLVK